MYCCSGTARPPQRFVPCRQVLLEIIGESSGEVLALGVRYLPALENGQDLVFDDVVADVLAQLRNGAGQLDGNVRDAGGIGHDCTRHGKALGHGRRADAPQFDLRELDPFLVHRQRPGGRLGRGWLYGGGRSGLRTYPERALNSGRQTRGEREDRGACQERDDYDD
ncbi:hypothetical protein ACVWYH_005828 [Bradyrhizobium sp. GM24.11]